jgi:hypothetical protein
LFVAVRPGCYLLLCKWLPLTLVIGQRLLEDGSVASVQLTRVTDTAKQGPASKFNAILLNYLPFIIGIIHANVGPGMMDEFENVL